MSTPLARRAVLVATLFSVAGCGGAQMSSVSPAGPGTAAQSESHRSGAQQIVPSTSFVHVGVPFAPRAPHSASARVRPSFQPAYSTKGVLLFEGDQSGQHVNIYRVKDLTSNPAPIATITDAAPCPYGMARDSSGTLYLANNCGASTITEYPKGQLTHTVEITDGISNPLGVAIDKSDTLYVSNYPPAITEYAGGSTSPTTTITGGGLADPFGLALDKKGNLYVADFGASQVFEIKAGTTTVTPLNLQDLEEPLGVAFDKKGNLWVTDGEGDKVNVYAPGSTTPSQTITAGYSFPYAISIDKTVVVSNISPPVAVYAYMKNQYTSYATLTNGVTLPTGLLITKL
jgi:hypothetical protein